MRRLATHRCGTNVWTHDELLLVQHRDGTPRTDLLIHEGLGEGRLVQFVMSPMQIVNEVPALKSGYLYQRRYTSKSTMMSCAIADPISPTRSCGRQMLTLRKWFLYLKATSTARATSVLRASMIQLVPREQRA